MSLLRWQFAPEQAAGILLRPFSSLPGGTQNVVGCWNAPRRLPKGVVKAMTWSSRIDAKPGSPGEAQCCGGLNPGGINKLLERENPRTLLVLTRQLNEGYRQLQAS
ncbi:hypothetical protein [Klebsiella aerogenes]|uniref:hypothetical protein n=4 Tax=Klebsiella aerogenes TaxID=548 RepID=UPI0012DCF6DE|nr:hypothetical protein [Klebsiella aerogenes]